MSMCAVFVHHLRYSEYQLRVNMATASRENPVGYSCEQDTSNNVVAPTTINQDENTEYVLVLHDFTPSTQPLTTI